MKSQNSKGDRTHIGHLLSPNKDAFSMMEFVLSYIHFATFSCFLFEAYSFFFLMRDRKSGW